MAKEWAAKDRGPRGATIIVVTICAPLIAILSTAIGEPILRTLLIQNISGRKEARMADEGNFVGLHNKEPKQQARADQFCQNRS